MLLPGTEFPLFTMGKSFPLFTIFHFFSVFLQQLLLLVPTRVLDVISNGFQEGRNLQGDGDGDQVL